MTLQQNNAKRRCSPLLCLPMMLWIASCGTTSTTTDVTTSAMAACPTPLYPTPEAWAYNDSLPRVTPAQIAFRQWTARVLMQQTLLDKK